MVNIFRKAKRSGKPNSIVVNYSAAVEDYADVKIMQGAIQAITDKIVQDWIEMYGDKLLKQITPKEVQQRIEKELAKKVLNS